MEFRVTPLPTSHQSARVGLAGIRVKQIIHEFWTWPQDVCGNPHEIENPQSPKDSPLDTVEAGKLIDRSSTLAGSATPLDDRTGGTWGMLEHLAVSDFVGLVGSVFRIVPDTSDVLDFELIEARGMTPAGAGSRGREPFSLTFRGPLRPVLAQRIYNLEHEAIGALEIFLVPIGTEGDPIGMHYQAIFG
jgi:hypothetical protein